MMLQDGDTNVISLLDTYGVVIDTPFLKKNLHLRSMIGTKIDNSWKVRSARKIDLNLKHLSRIMMEIYFI